MSTTAFDDQFVTAPEPVRQPYDTASILRRNVADLELTLKRQTELKEKAEAELAQARQQKPLTWGTSGELMDILKNPIYSSPSPVPAPAVPELDPMTRLIVSDPKQLKPKKQEPAVPSVVFMAHNKTSSILFAAREDADQYAAAAGPTAGVSVTECAVIGSQSAPQAPAAPTNTIPEGDDFNGTTPHMIRCIESLVSMNDERMQAKPMARNIPGDTCEICGAAEIDYMSPRTKYACGSSDYDKRPGTFKRGDNCIDAAADRLLEGGE